MTATKASGIIRYSSTHPLADLWPILVQLQWNGQSRTGLSPYPRSCDHEFTSWRVASGQKKIQIKQKKKGKTNKESALPNRTAREGVRGSNPQPSATLPATPEKRTQTEKRLNQQV